MTLALHALLATSPLLATAPPAARERLAAWAELHPAARGALVFEQSAPADHLYLVIEGRIALRVTGEDGAATVLDILGPGETFPIASVLLDLPQNAAAVAIATSRLLRIPAAVFRAALGEDAGVSRAVAEHVCRQWRRLAEQLLDLKLRDGARRVARYLAAGLPPSSAAGPVDLPEPRAAIAAQLGMTPESLSRTLHAFADAGLLQLAGRRVTVLDRAALLAAPRPPAPRARTTEAQSLRG